MDYDTPILLGFACNLDSTDSWQAELHKIGTGRYRLVIIGGALPPWARRVASWLGIKAVLRVIGGGYHRASIIGRDEALAWARENLDGYTVGISF